jgi:hypothetical protein
VDLGPILRRKRTPENLPRGTCGEARASLRSRARATVQERSGELPCRPHRLKTQRRLRTRLTSYHRERVIIHPRNSPDRRSGDARSRPPGKDSNWVPTSAAGKFEVLFRFYGPEKALFDKTWMLPDVAKAN